MLPHDRIAYSPIVERPPLRLPNGARVAVWAIVEQIYADTSDSARVMALAVHPYIMGAPHGLKYFRRIFETIRKKDDVLFWTGTQIVDWCVRAGPKAS
jgi:hypothetical protein